jgi:glycosyltransferase involved in cell wall biosynthesis
VSAETPLDIEILTVAVPPRLGGMTTWMRQIAEGLAREGWRVRLLGISEELTTEAGTSFQSLLVPTTPITGGPGVLWDKWSRWRKVAEWFKGYRMTNPAPRILLSDSTPGVLSLTRRIAEQHRIPWFVVAGGDIFRETQGNWWSPLLHSRVRRDLTAADLIVVDGPDLVESLSLRGIPRDRFSVVYQGIDTQKFHPPREDRLGGDFTAVWHGRLADHHGPLRFLEVVERVEGVRGRMCGGGPLEAQLRARLQQSGKETWYAGRVPLEDLPSHLGRGDCGVYPLQAMAGVPTVLLEAMAVGLPCIAARVGAVSQLIDSGSNGFLCDTPEEMIQVLRDLKDDPDRCRRIGEAAASTIRESWSAKATLKPLVDLVREAMQP